MNNSETYGACKKHPNFNMVSCPECKIDEIEEKIKAGRYVIKQSKEQLKNLYNEKKEFERLISDINKNSNDYE